MARTSIQNSLVDFVKGWTKIITGQVNHWNDTLDTFKENKLLDLDVDQTTDVKTKAYMAFFDKETKATTLKVDGKDVTLYSLATTKVPNKNTARRQFQIYTSAIVNANRVLVKAGKTGVLKNKTDKVFHKDHWSLDATEMKTVAKGGYSTGTTPPPKKDKETKEETVSRLTLELVKAIKALPKAKRDGAVSNFNSTYYSHK